MQSCRGICLLKIPAYCLSPLATEASAIAYFMKNELVDLGCATP